MALVEGVGDGIAKHPTEGDLLRLRQLFVPQNEDAVRPESFPKYPDGLGIELLPRTPSLYIGAQRAICGLDIEIICHEKEGNTTLPTFQISPLKEPP